MPLGSGEILSAEDSEDEQNSPFFDNSVAGPSRTSNPSAAGASASSSADRRRAEERISGNCSTDLDSMQVREFISMEVAESAKRAWELELIELFFALHHTLHRRPVRYGWPC